MNLPPSCDSLVPSPDRSFGVKLRNSVPAIQGCSQNEYPLGEFTKCSSTITPIWAKWVSNAGLRKAGAGEAKLD